MLKASVQSLLLVAAFAACSSQVADDGTGGSGGVAPVADCEAPSAPQDFELGTGELCFERVAEDGSINMMAGPQGGFHLFFGLGCADCGSSVQLEIQVLDPSTLQPIEGTYLDQTVVSLVEAEGWPQAAGIQIGMPGTQWDTETGALPKGTPILVKVEASSSGGELLHSGELSLVIGDTLDWDPCDANPDGPCCGGLCN